MKIKVKDVESTAYLALPQNQAGLGILVLHPWWGLNLDIKTVCDRLGQAGYVALAPDFYDGRIATTINEADKLSDALDQAKVNKLLGAAVDQLLDHPACQGTQIGVIGFSLGAYLTSWLIDNKPKQLKSIMFFYGLGAGNPAKTEASYLGHFAESDPYESATERDEFEAMLKENGRSVTFHVYPNTEHWFFEPSCPDAYNPTAAKLAWERTLRFLAETLG